MTAGRSSSADGWFSSADGWFGGKEVRLCRQGFDRTGLAFCPSLGYYDRYPLGGWKTMRRGAEMPEQFEHSASGAVVNMVYDNGDVKILAEDAIGEGEPVSDADSHRA